MISRARVKLAMGHISPEGYRAFVRELESRCADIEVKLAREHLGRA